MLASMNQHGSTIGLLPWCDVSTEELAFTQEATLVLFAFTKVLLFRQMGELNS
jgi:hypothetical protein